jgi:tRNA threonylcarbamoyladenosine biosynthesis protein TsaE
MSRVQRIVESGSAAETEACGRNLARELKAGDIVALQGELGAGKTCWVQGVATALSVHEAVRSPTFTLINEYHGRLPIYHFDLYRLNRPQELEELGYEEYFFGDGICILEWAEKAGRLLPPCHWLVHFKILSEQARRIEIYPPCPGSHS